MKRTLLASLFLGTCLHAEPEGGFANASTSAHLERLAAFGIPAPGASAKWTHHPQCEDADTSDWDLAISSALMVMTGNCWLQPGDDGKPSILPPGHVGSPVIIAAGNEDHPPASAANLESDVRAVIQLLEQETASSDSYSGQIGLHPGCLLVFATQLHLLAETKLANDLADAVFALTRSQQDAMAEAIDFLGDERLNEITSRFFTTRDWAAYHQALAQMHERFPPQWTRGRALPLIMPRIEQRLAGSAPPSPTLPDMAIEADALAAIAPLATGPEGAPSTTLDIPQLWILRENRDLTKQRNSLPDLTALGTGALPVLAALLGDPWLTHYPNPSQGPPRYSTMDSEDQQLRAIHAKTPRPLARGEVARMFLTEALPNGNMSILDEEDSESLRQRALAFWRDNRNANGTELAIRFMRDGDGLQRFIATESLISSNDPAAWQGVEQHILRDERAISQHEVVRKYLALRQAGAKPFLDAYVRLVRAQCLGNADGAEDEAPPEARAAGSLDLFLGSLEAIINGQSLRDHLAAIAAGKSGDTRAAISFLTDNRQRVPAAALGPALLDSAAATTDSKLRAMFLVAALDLDWEPADTQPSPVSASRKPSEAEAAAWQSLMADTRAAPETPQCLSSHGRAESMSDLAAAAISRATSPGYFRRILLTAPALGRNPLAMIREHAKAILDGAPPPGLPDPSRVKPERFREILAAAASKAPLDLHPFLSTLPTDERAAWAAWLSDPSSGPQLPPAIYDMGWTIIGQTKKNNWPYPRLDDAPPFVPGFVLSGKSLSAACDVIAKDIDKYSRIMIHLDRAKFGPGLEACAVRLPAPHPAETAPPRIPTTSAAFAHAATELKSLGPADGVILLIIERGGYPSLVAWTVRNQTASPVDLATVKGIDQFLADYRSFNTCRFRIDILSTADADRILAILGDHEPAPEAPAQPGH